MSKYFWISLIILTGACRKNPDTVNGQQLNVAYGNELQQKMDIYLPADRTLQHTKVLIMIHGGGWASGDKSDFNEAIPVIRQRLPDYAVFNLNYRLATTDNNRFPAQEDDIRAAIQFIYDQRIRFRISDRFVLLGASAGGHLALLQSYKYNNPVKPRAVISFFGPADLISLYNDNATAAFLLNFALGATPAQATTLYTLSSPVTFVHAGCPPTLLLQGGQDELVPPSQANILLAALEANGVTSKYVYYPSEGHGWTGSNLVDSYEKITAFLEAQVP